MIKNVFKNNKKVTLLFALIAMFLVSLTLGFSMLSSTLTITGKSTVKKNSWIISAIHPFSHCPHRDAVLVFPSYREWSFQRRSFGGSGAPVVLVGTTQHCYFAGREGDRPFATVPADDAGQFAFAPDVSRQQ